MRYTDGYGNKCELIFDKYFICVFILGISAFIFYIIMNEKALALIMLFVTTFPVFINPDIIGNIKIIKKGKRK
jgi:hypothetical protein